MIRPARPEDAVALNELTRAAYAPWQAIIGREPLPMLTDYAVAIEKYDVIVVEEDATVIALIELISAPDHLLIENIAIAPDHQGKGLGETLLQVAEEHARKIGQRELRLYTNNAFTGNVAFYVKRGFTEIAREALPDGGEVVHMSRAVR